MKPLGSDVVSLIEALMKSYGGNLRSREGSKSKALMWLPYVSNLKDGPYVDTSWEPYGEPMGSDGDK